MSQLSTKCKTVSFAVEKGLSGLRSSTLFSQWVRYLYQKNMYQNVKHVSECTESSGTMHPCGLSAPVCCGFREATEIELTKGARGVRPSP